MGKYWFIIYKIWYTKNIKFSMSTFFNSLIVFYYSHVLIVHLLLTIVAALNFYGPNCMYWLSEHYIQSESKNRIYNSQNRISLEFFHWNIKLIVMSWHKKVTGVNGILSEPATNTLPSFLCLFGTGRVISGHSFSPST